MGCGGGRWPRVPWDMGGCGYPYPSPLPYPRGDHGPDGGAAAGDGTDEVIHGELKKLYAKGEITREQYLTAVGRLDQGTFSLDDLWELRRNAAAGQGAMGEGQAEIPAPGRAVTATASTGADVAALKQKREEISQAEKGIDAAIETANQTIDRLRKEMARLEDSARVIVKSDESLARSYLEQRQAIAEQVSELEARLDGLKGDSERLNVLRLRLEAKIAAQDALAKEDVVSRLEKELQELE